MQDPLQVLAVFQSFTTAVIDFLTSKGSEPSAQLPLSPNRRCLKSAQAQYSCSLAQIQLAATRVPPVLVQTWQCAQTCNEAVSSGVRRIRFPGTT